MNILQLFAQTYQTTTTTLTDAEAAAAVAVLMSFLGFIFFASLIVYVLMAVALMRVFKKAGLDKPWAAWVPVYNSWKMLEIGGQQGFWALLAFVPVVNIAAAIFFIIAEYNIGLKLGKGGGFVVLAIFFPFIWALWLAFDSSTWNESAGAPSLAGDPVAPAAPAPTPEAPASNDNTPPVV